MRIFIDRRDRLHRQRRRAGSSRTRTRRRRAGASGNGFESAPRPRRRHRRRRSRLASVARRLARQLRRDPPHRAVEFGRRAGAEQNRARRLHRAAGFLRLHLGRLGLRQHRHSTSPTNRRRPIRCRSWRGVRSRNRPRSQPDAAPSSAPAASMAANKASAPDGSNRPSRSSRSTSSATATISGRW